MDSHKWTHSTILRESSTNDRVQTPEHDWLIIVLRMVDNQSLHWLEIIIDQSTELLCYEKKAGAVFIASVELVSLPSG